MPITYTYESKSVKSQDGSGFVVEGEGQIFAPSDTTFASPLTSYDLSGLPQETISIVAGGTEEFHLDDYGVVIWRESAGATTGVIQAAGVLVPPGGTTGQVLAKVTATDHDVNWIDPPEGGGGTATWETLPGVPATFPPSSHTHDGSSITVSIPGVTATNVSAALSEVKATAGSGGASGVLVWRYTGGQWPTLPASKPAGVSIVMAVGPSFPASPPSWTGLDGTKALLSYQKVAAL